MKLSFGISVEISTNGIHKSHYTKKFIDGGRICNESATCDNTASAFNVKEDVECDGEELRIYGDILKDMIHEVSDLAEKIKKPVQEAVEKLNGTKEASSAATQENPEEPEEIKLKKEVTTA